MPHSDRADSNDPLLGSSPKLTSDRALQPISPTTQAIVKVLTLIRVVTGAACLVAPRYTCALFRISVPAEQAIVVRMVGIRDVVFGGLLITAEDKDSGDGGRREMRRAIWAGIAVDAVDIASLAFGVAVGQIGNATGGLLGAAAVGALGLGAVGLGGL
ncbi:hypothetical protein CC86DRAFT_163193 [Ophiobolus disseminans]|uniref:Uncharacterized protein n=1 Tax=Ophiobolus disseminans TaxID=1469910 RepID=A0A6A7AB83_9PLEO|nr:hypothetical protein CC86DRAFT_163193 [Ophiobolus disseminans]